VGGWGRGSIVEESVRQAGEGEAGGRWTADGKKRGEEWRG
jgi:hypothetical protein